MAGGIAGRWALGFFEFGATGGVLCATGAPPALEDEGTRPRPPLPEPHPVMERIKQAITAPRAIERSLRTVEQSAVNKAKPRFLVMGECKSRIPRSTHS